MKEKYKSCQAYAIDNIIVVADSIEQAIELYNSYTGGDVEPDSIQNLITPSRYRNAIRPSNTCAENLCEVSKDQDRILALLESKDALYELRQSISNLQKYLDICCKEVSCPLNVTK